MSEVTEAQLDDEILEVLERSGPLCASQISAELLLPPKQVGVLLENLQARGKVSRRPDPDRDYNDESESEMPWGSTRRIFAIGA